MGGAGLRARPSPYWSISISSRKRPDEQEAISAHTDTEDLLLVTNYEESERRKLRILGAERYVR